LLTTTEQASPAGKKVTKALQQDIFHKYKAISHTLSNSIVMHYF